MTVILGIETSCDDTAAAVVRDGRVMHSNIVSSQTDLHAQYGGVFPEVASRAHIETISGVVDLALTQADTSIDQIDAIAVTQGPGLVGSLLVGIHYAKGLALATGKPLLGINHLEGHIYSLWLTPDVSDVVFPVLVLIVSGGHTELILMRGHDCYRRLGSTLDDAAGEAFDKVGRLLGLPFPGGPAIERAASNGDSAAYDFPRARLDDSFDFSFSGLKTAVMREVTVQPTKRSQRQRGAEKVAGLRADVDIDNVAAAFQEALTEALRSKTVAAAKRFGAQEIFLCGGVSANTLLREKLRDSTDIPLRFPPLALCTDNAAMIGAAACYRRSEAPLDLDVFSTSGPEVFSPGS
jgi:N6-L-threonylcarbamoyladenine synthase